MAALPPFLVRLVPLLWCLRRRGLRGWGWSDHPSAVHWSYPPNRDGNAQPGLARLLRIVHRRGEASMSRPNKIPDVNVTTETRPAEETRTRRIPPYNVVLLNDDHHSMEFVMGVLCKVLGCAAERAYTLM